jgi:hypothetical protein
MMINESFDADYNSSIPGQKRAKKRPTLRMDAVSSISAMNVDTPLSCESPAPTRHRIESNMGRLAEEQGTKHPAWAIRTITPT